MMDFGETMKRCAFTLVELLVVLAIIGVLVGLLLPAVQMVREAARRTHCSNNLRQIVIGLHNYEASNTDFPPGWLADESPSTKGWAWMSYVLPFVEQQSIYDEINFGMVVRDLPIEGVRTSTIDMLFCPSSTINKYDKAELQSWADDLEDFPFPIGRSQYVGSIGGRVPFEDMPDGER